jgi:hypothetical protein
MTDTEIAKIEIALRSKPSQQNLEWNEFREIYFLVLAPVPSQYAQSVLLWILRDCKVWRPTTDQIHDYCLRLAGCVSPDGAAVVREVRSAIARFGKFGRPVPGRNLHLLGTPRMSLAALRFVDQRGGWPALLETAIGNEEIFWHQAEADASAVCETLKIEQERSRCQPMRPLLPAGAPQ